MLEFNGKTLCEHCFAPVAPDMQCGRCGWFGYEEITTALPEGTVLCGRYIVGQAIYYDGSYHGYYGYDAEANKRVLIKELFPGGGNCRRQGKNVVCDGDLKRAYIGLVQDFHTEVKIMSELNSPEAVTPLESTFDENGTSYSVVNFPETAMLLSEMMGKRGGHLDSSETVFIMEGIIKAMAVIHDRGYIHGNIKPENIIIDGKNVILTGLSYGNSKYLSASTGSLYSADINSYAPLEMFKENDDRNPRTDIYALGTTLYNMFTGRKIPNAFARLESMDEQVDVIEFYVADQTMNNIKPILTMMTAMRAADRFPDVDSLVLALKTAKIADIKIKRSKSAAPSQAAPAKAYGAAPVKKKSKAPLIIILVVLIAALLAVGGWFAWTMLSDKDDDDSSSGSKKPPVLGEMTPGEETPGEETPGEETPGEDVPGEDEPGEDVPGEENPGVTEPEESPEEKTEEVAPSKVTIEPHSLSLAVGETVTLYATVSPSNATNKSVTWTSSNVKVAAVDGNGTVVAKDVGTATIMVRTSNGKSATCDVKVIDSEVKSDEPGEEPNEPTTTTFAWRDNILAENESTVGHDKIFGYEGYHKNDICHVVFYDSTKEVKIGSWDASRDKDGSVKAWITGSGNNLTLHIAADGGINGQYATENLFRGFEKLVSVKMNGAFRTDYATSMKNMFKDCKKLESIDLTGLVTSQVTDMSSMFENCFALTNITISKSFYTLKVTNMSHMFDSCKAMKTFDLAVINTSSVTDMSYMFYGCTSLETLDIGHFTTTKATTMERMFAQCRKLTTLSIKGFSAVKSVNIYAMFDKCSKLEEIDNTNPLIQDEFSKRND